MKNVLKEEILKSQNLSRSERRKKEIGHLITNTLISSSNSDLNNLETNFQLRFDD